LGGDGKAKSGNSNVNPSTYKRVAVRLHPVGGTRKQELGFLDPAQLTSKERFTLLSPAGQAIELDREAVVAVFFIADFEHPPSLQKSRSLPRAAGTRRTGIAVRIEGHDRHVVEGILSSDLMAVAQGVWLSGPRSDGEWERAFIPPHAIAKLSVVDVVRAPRTRSPRKRRASPQLPLFEAEEKP
jgi:hypothetical protein